MIPLKKIRGLNQDKSAFLYSTNSRTSYGSLLESISETEKETDPDSKNSETSSQLQYRNNNRNVTESFSKIKKPPSSALTYSQYSDRYTEKARQQIPKRHFLTQRSSSKPQQIYLSQSDIAENRENQRRKSIGRRWGTDKLRMKSNSFREKNISVQNSVQSGLDQNQFTSEEQDSKYKKINFQGTNFQLHPKPKSSEKSQNQQIFYSNPNNSILKLNPKRQIQSQVKKSQQNLQKYSSKLDTFIKSKGSSKNISQIKQQQISSSQNISINIINDKRTELKMESSDFEDDQYDLAKEQNQQPFNRYHHNDPYLQSTKILTKEQKNIFYKSIATDYRSNKLHSIGISKIYSNNSNQNRQIRRAQFVSSTQSNLTNRTFHRNIKQKSRSKTLRTLTDRQPQSRKQYSIAIIEYCSHQIGLSFYNNTTGQFHLCQMIENMTYFRVISTIQTFSPIQIIYPLSLQKTLLIKIIKQNFRRTSFKSIQRKNFDQKMGMAIYMQTSSAEQLSLNSKFLAFACFNALIHHIQQNSQLKIKRKALNVKWHRIEQLLIIEPSSIADLQIFYNSQTKKNKKCLVENFNCITCGGNRLLRANLLQPPSDLKVILDRQNLLQKILQNPSLIQTFSNQLYKYKYYEPITAKFIKTPKQQNLISLKTYLSAIFQLSNQCLGLQRLYSKLQETNSFQLPILNKLDQKLQCNKLKLLKSTIQQNFQPNVISNYDQFKKKKDRFLFLFKIDKIENQFAQITRIGYKRTVDTIFEYYNQVKRKIKKQIQLINDENLGYFFRTSDLTIDFQSIAQKLQQNIVQITTKGKSITFSTQILTSLNNRIKQSQKILILQSQTCLRKVIHQIQQNIAILFQINQILSTIDMVMSFCKFILKFRQITKFTRPKFIKGGNKFTVQKIKPVWLFNINNQQEIQIPTLDINLPSKQNATILLQKSTNSINQLTKLGSIAYSVILSQIGCFLPAQSAQLSPFQCIISKIYVSQSGQMGLSRFQLNLVKIQNIFDNAFTKQLGRCLILMDQIVKGSQHQQQCALSLSIIKRLLRVEGVSYLLTSDRMLLHFLNHYPEFKRVVLQRSQDWNAQRQAVERIGNESIYLMREYNYCQRFIQDFNQINISINYRYPKLQQEEYRHQQ